MSAIAILLPELDVPFTFTRRPSPLDPELRPEWRLSVLVLLLRVCCRGTRSSLRKLHLLNWTIRSNEARLRLFALLDETIGPEDIEIRVEPALNRAIDFAAAEGLVRFVGGDKVELTPSGVSLAAEIVSAPDCLVHERAFMERLRLRLTEQKVTEILKGNGA